MTRAELEHVIRAACQIADDDVVVVGSQAILGQFPDAPAGLLVSNEADVFPGKHPERSDLIDGSIGEGSPFHETYGYYAQGVGPETAILPAGWKERLVPVRQAAGTGWCLEVHDLLLAKAAAGREKDLAFLGEALSHGLASRQTLVERCDALPLPAEARERVRRRVLAAPGPG